MMTEEFLERTQKYLLCQSWYLSGARSLESSNAFNWLMEEKNQQLYLSGSDDGLPKLVKLAKYFLLEELVLCISRLYRTPELLRF